jgi:hypothetical protein
MEPPDAGTVIIQPYSSRDKQDIGNENASKRSLQMAGIVMT